MYSDPKKIDALLEAYFTQNPLSVFEENMARYDIKTLIKYVYDGCYYLSTAKNRNMGHYDGKQLQI